MLRRQAKSGFALAFGRDAIIGDEVDHEHSVEFWFRLTVLVTAEGDNGSMFGRSLVIGLKRKPSGARLV